MNFIWGGTGTWVQDTMNRDCGDYSSSSNASSYTVGWGDSSTSGWIVGGLFTCDTFRPILCVDQVPVTPRATH